jgi:hypothetical protein
MGDGQGLYRDAARDPHLYRGCRTRANLIAEWSMNRTCIYGSLSSVPSQWSRVTNGRSFAIIVIRAQQGSLKSLRTFSPTEVPMR